MRLVFDHEIALRTNQLIARSLLARASGVRLRMEGNVRPVVWQAKLRGLICDVADAAPPVLGFSGPCSLFRRTLLYGRALGEILPFPGWCGRFELEAECFLRGERAVLHLRSGDPLFPGDALRPFDSQLERRFAADLKKAAPDWDLVREPEPIRAAGTIIFPDFLLRHRLDARGQFLVEIMGFWTPEYVRRKLERLRAARLDRLILCMDDACRCDDGALPPGAGVVRFERRFDPSAVLAAPEAADARTNEVDCA
jgi:predicted nuclease of restriction endonuclease-like RecB superfamily